MNKLGTYILGQLQELAPVTKRPVLESIEDKGYKVILKFSINNEPVTVSVNDLYLAKLSEGLTASLHAPRNKFIRSLHKEISASLREDLDQNSKSIDFFSPISEELMNQAKQLAGDFLSNPNMYMNTNIEYMLSLGSPVFIFNTIKIIVDIMRQKNMVVPNSFLNAIRDPEHYLNPDVIIERDDIIDEVECA